MMYAELNENDELVNGAPVKIHRKPVSFSGATSGIQYPRNWWQATSMEEKAAAHIYPFIPHEYDDEEWVTSGDPVYTFDGVQVTEELTLVPYTAGLERKAERQKRNLLSYADSLTGEKVEAAATPPTDLQDQRAVNRLVLMAVGNTRKEGKGRPDADTAMLDNLEAWFDIVRPIYGAGEAIKADIEAGTITTNEEVDTDPRWGG